MELVRTNKNSLLRVRSNPGTTRAAHQQHPSLHFPSDTNAGQDAERIAGYIYAYKDTRPATGRYFLRQQLTDDPMSSPKSPFDLQPAYKGKRMVVVDLSKEDRWQAKLRAATKEMNELDSDIALGKSDKLELERDLDTYEYLFAAGSRVREKLASVIDTTERMPEFITVSEEFAKEAHGLFRRISSGLEQLQDLRREESPERLRRQLDLRMRAEQTSHHLKTCFRGVSCISNQFCLIHVVGNNALTDLRISVVTPSAEKLQLHIKQKAVSERDAGKYIKSTVLPRLFIKWEKTNGAVLAADPGVGKTFVTLFVRLKGEKRPGLVLVKEDFGDVAFFAPGIEAHLSVPIEKITNLPSVFSLPLRRLRQLIEEKLLIVGQRERLLWCGEGAEGANFRLKEKSSKLLDPDYLSEMLHDFVQVLVAKEEVTIDGQAYTVELYAHKSVEKLRITHRDRYEDIGTDSHLLRLVRGLQFTLLQTSVRTMVRSLEFAWVVRATFTPKMIAPHATPAFVNSR